MSGTFPVLASGEQVGTGWGFVRNLGVRLLFRPAELHLVTAPAAPAWGFSLAPHFGQRRALSF